MFLIHFPRVILLILLIVKLILLLLLLLLLLHSGKLWVRAPLMSMISMLRMNCTAIVHMILISSSSNRWRSVVLFVSFLGRRSKGLCLMHSTAMRMLLIKLRTVNLIRDMLTLKVGAFVFLNCACSTQLSKDLVQICLHLLLTGFLRLHELIKCPTLAINLHRRVILWIRQFRHSISHSVLQIQFKPKTLPNLICKQSTVAKIADLVPEFYTKTCLETLIKEQSSPAPPHDQITTAPGILHQNRCLATLAGVTCLLKIWEKFGYFSMDLGGRVGF
jgi:hypothetical protein